MTDLAKVKELRQALNRLVKENEEHLTVSGEATFRVIYTVTATVHVPFQDLHLADRSGIAVSEHLAGDQNGVLVDGFIVTVTDAGYEPIDGDVLHETVQDSAHYDIPEDLDDYAVSVEDVTVDDYDLEEIALDPSSKLALSNWNAKAEEA